MYSKDSIKDLYIIVLLSLTINLCVLLLETINIRTYAMCYSHFSPSLYYLNSLMSFIKLATMSIKFSLNDVMYWLMDGASICSPLGPAMINIFLRFYEQRTFANAK